MKKVARIALPIWTVIMILFFFVPMGGNTGWQAATQDGSIMPYLGAGAGIACWVSLLYLSVSKRK